MFHIFRTKVANKKPHFRDYKIFFSINISFLNPPYSIHFLLKDLNVLKKIFAIFVYQSIKVKKELFQIFNNVQKSKALI